MTRHLTDRLEENDESPARSSRRNGLRILEIEHVEDRVVEEEEMESGTAHRPLAPSTPRRKEKAGPLRNEQSVGLWERLRGNKFADARTARVYVTRTGEKIPFMPDAQPLLGSLLWKRVRRVYEVDMCTHQLVVEAQLPSRGDHFAFTAVIDLAWRAQDPVEIVNKGVSRVREALTPGLLARLRSVTRRFDIDQVHQAETAVGLELENFDPGVEFGLWTRVYVRLTMDDTTLEHAAIRRRAEQFRTIIAEGDFQQFALQLALRPEDVASVVKELVQERDNSRSAVFDVVTKLLESDALERWQVEDHVRAMLKWLSDSGNKVLTGTDEARAVPFEIERESDAS